MNLPRLIASGAGAGYAPRAPGTAGSLLGLVLGGGLLYFSHGAELLGILLVSAAGFWAVGEVGAAGDPGWIVIDEVAGQMIALFALPRISLPGLALAFILFRLFDITKLGPVGLLNARHDALGVMGDDWAAGGLALACLAILLFLFPLTWP